MYQQLGDWYVTNVRDMGSTFFRTAVIAAHKCGFVVLVHLGALPLAHPRRKARLLVPNAVSISLSSATRVVASA
jgi:hypothetical protein